ncbi:MAG TPA: YetF domain-containing protein [Polyangiales bacterium]|jgi:uncharacterized membrane protein YcaP (DUF421 family)|nr:YetF domain-containing protein [Polyangiales bacterium]
MPGVVSQILLALAYYAGLLVIVRLAGKRLAGQTTTFDLLVLIAIGVVLQGLVLRPGQGNALTFVVTVFAAHRGLTVWSSRSRRVRRLMRGAPTPLVHDGQVSMQALADENMSYDDLMAGLRKLGFDDPRRVRLATLEETGQISAVPRE